MHVTLRARKAAAFLRGERVFAHVRRAFAEANREVFRIVHFSVQRDHVHLLVEARDADALGSGMRGLTTRGARAVNRALGRRGRVWGDRYHRQDVQSPQQLRRVLVYVLRNHAKHEVTEGMLSAVPLDPLSSSVYFGGWCTRAGPALARLRSRLPEEERRALERRRSAERRGDAAALAAAEKDLERLRPVRAPRTWLLSAGWSKYGPVDLRETPRPPLA